MMDENKLLLAGLEDKYDRFIRCNYLVTTDFFNMNQQAVALSFLKHHQDVKAFFYGGYGDAERRQVVFVPDYLEVSDEEGLLGYFEQNPDECPLVVLSLTHHVGGHQGLAGGSSSVENGCGSVGGGRTGKKGGGKESGSGAGDGGRTGRNGRVLTHRDYLGSLLGEGIRREKLGDILVSEHGAQVVVIRELAEYLAAHYGKAGRVSLDVQVLPINAISTAISARDTVKFTVSSPRLDSIVAGVFRVSRKDAAAAIMQGRVFVNEALALKPDMNLKGGEKVVLRGKGKAIFTGVSGMSKKGKMYVTMEKYV